jgi:hypothetical protein
VVANSRLGSVTIGGATVVGKSRLVSLNLNNGAHHATDIIASSSVTVRDSDLDLERAVVDGSAVPVGQPRPRGMSFVNVEASVADCLRVARTAFGLNVSGTPLRLSRSDLFGSSTTDAPSFDLDNTTDVTTESVWWGQPGGPLPGQVRDPSRHVDTAPLAAPSSCAVAAPLTPPGPVAAVAATSGDGSLRVTWSPPVDDGGGAITSYRISVAGRPALEVSAGTRSASITGLQNFKRSEVAVRAVNAAGAGSPRIVGAVPWPTVPPSVSHLAWDSPQNLMSSLRATVHWTAPGSSDVAQIVGRIQAGAVAPTTITSGVGAFSTSGTRTSAMVAGLAPGQDYALRVFTVNPNHHSDKGVAIVLRGSTLSLTADRNEVWQQPVHVSGVLRRASDGVALGSRRIRILERTHGGSQLWYEIGALTTRSDGSYSGAVPLALPWSADLRAVYDGGVGRLGGTSPARSVTVHPAVVLSPASTMMAAGATYTLRGTLRGEESPTKLRLYAWTAVGWTQISERTISSSTFEFRMRPGRGNHAYRVKTDAGVMVGDGTSNIARVSVS